MCIATRFHSLPYNAKPDKNAWCSAAVHRPADSSEEDASGVNDDAGADAGEANESSFRC
jgi:hypothetical protein